MNKKNNNYEKTMSDVKTEITKFIKALDEYEWKKININDILLQNDYKITDDSTEKLNDEISKYIDKFFTLDIQKHIIFKTKVIWPDDDEIVFRPFITSPEIIRIYDKFVVLLMIRNVDLVYKTEDIDQLIKNNNYNLEIDK